MQVDTKRNPFDARTMDEWKFVYDPKKINIQAPCLLTFVDADGSLMEIDTFLKTVQLSNFELIHSTRTENKTWEDTKTKFLEHLETIKEMHSITTLHHVLVETKYGGKLMFEIFKSVYSNCLLYWQNKRTKSVIIH
jgi:hypothetical protein